MQFDSNMLKALLSVSDAELWSTIYRIAKANGISISETPPPKAEMEKLREILAGAESADYKKALALISSYKR